MTVPQKYDMALILRWYECERKQALTRDEAVQRSTEIAAAGPPHVSRGVHPAPYLCPYGDHWHIGAPANAGRRPQKNRRVNARSQYKKDVASGKIMPFAHLTST